MQYIDCLINPLTRTVQYPGNTTIVQRDTNVEVLRFHYSLGAQHELENDSIRIMVASGKEVRGFQAENVRTELNDGGDEELVFEHTITSYETSKAGQITVSVCGNKVTGNTITEAWHTLNMAFQVANAIHTESDEGEDTPETAASNAEKIAALQTLVDAITSGRPIPVDLKSKMTDTSAIYLYTGNETGEQHNYWYYHDGTTWVPGSEYGGMTIDDELSSTSENAVKNKVIKANFDEVNGRLQWQEHLTDAGGETVVADTQGFEPGSITAVVGSSISFGSESWFTHCHVNNVSEFDKFLLTVRVSNANQIYAVGTDDNDTVVYVWPGMGAAGTYTDKEIVIPAGVTKLYVGAQTAVTAQGQFLRVKQYIPNRFATESYINGVAANVRNDLAEVEKSIETASDRLTQHEDDYYAVKKLAVDLTAYSQNNGYAWNRNTLELFSVDGYNALGPISIEKNTKYVLEVRVGSNGSQRAYILVDENGTKIEEADAVNTYVNKTYDIDSKNATQIYITSTDRPNTYLSKKVQMPVVKNDIALLSDEENTLWRIVGNGFFTDGENCELTTATGGFVGGTVGDSIRVSSRGATAHAYFNATPGEAYKIGFYTFLAAEKFVFAVDENGTIIKTWVDASSESLIHVDIYVVAPIGTSKIYFNYQQYNAKYAKSATILPMSESFPSLSRNDWKKCFKLSNAFTEETYIKSGTGIAYSSPNWKTTGFIKVTSGESIRYSLIGYANETAAICFYDTNKKYVSEIKYAKSDGYFADGVVTVEQDGYIRVSVKNTAYNPSSLVWEDYLPTDGMQSTIKQSAVLANFLEGEYKRTVESVQQVSTEDTASFVFFTDLHYAVNHGYVDLCAAMERNYTAIKRIASELPISVVVAGGDYEMLGNVAAGVVKQDGIDIIYHVNRYMSNMPVPSIALAGNHELGYNSGGEAGTIAGTDNGLTNDEVYKYLGKKYASGHINKASKEVYYLTDEVNGIFFLFLSTTTPGRLTLQSTLDSINIALAANDKKYPVVVFNHYALTGTGELFNSAIQSVIEKIVTDGHDIVAWIGGHNHSDWCNTVTVGSTSVLVISCLQSGVLNSEVSQDGNTYTHTYDTDTESAFSVFTVNKNLGKLYLTRFGAGVDREFNYNTISGSVGLVTNANG